MSKVIKPSEFNINKINIINDVKNLKNGMKVLNIHYDGNREVLLQTPEFTLPFDADCLDGRLQICMNLDKGYFKKKMEKMDKLVSDMGMKNSQQWLKKSKLSDETLDMFFSRSVKQQGDYKPKFKFKTDNTTKFYGTDKNLIVEDVTGISKGQRLVAIIKPKYVWINSGKFGVTWVASQICLKGGANDNDFSECVLSDDE